MRRLLVVASLFVAHTAFAQAPGEMQPNYAPVAAPVPVVVAAPVFQPRWSVGLSIGGLSLAPQNSPDNQTNYSVGEITLRYRLTHHLELEGAVGGGREQLPNNGGQGDREADVVALNLRYRFRALQHWNWWIGAGIGAMTVASHTATDQQKQDAERGMFQLGVGIEHRWTHFALQAELRAIGTGSPKSDTMTTVPVNATAATAVTPDDKQSGGLFTLGASYYF